MEFLYLLFNFLYSLVVILGSRYVFKNYINPLSVFVVWILFNLSVAIWNPSELYSLSDSVILFTYLSVGSVTASVLVCDIVKHHTKGTCIFYNNVDQRVVNNLFIFILAFIGFIVTVYIAYKMSNIGMSIVEDARNIRRLFFRGGVFTYIIPISWVLNGILEFLIAYSLFLLYKNKKGMMLFLTTSLLFIIFDIAQAGRSGMLTIVFSILSLWLLSKSVSFQINKYIKVMMSISLAFLFISLVMMSFLRYEDSSIGTVFFKIYGLNFISPFVLFDHLIHDTALPNIRFGISLLGFDILFITGIARFLFGFELPSLLSMISGYRQAGINVSDNLVSNANYTYMFGPFIDGGVLFLIVWSFILGIFFYYTYQRFSKNDCLFWFLIYYFCFKYILFAPLFSIVESGNFGIIIPLVILTRLKLLTKRVRETG